ncbi:MAG: CpaF family protein [Armatimonadota bacterium]|nr:CpaF family protein [Armatimonadota bacterium]MDR5703215.1 CpaF family protein [Armatimonadota bacterium]MDR7435506.1 CpaF family protein [Armatimonadota bacterium]
MKANGDIRNQLQRRLIEEVDVVILHNADSATVRRRLEQLIHSYLLEYPQLSAAERHQLAKELCDDITGFGPLESLLADPLVTDILVNRWDRVYVERRGRLERTSVAFRDESHLRHIIERIAALAGRRIDESSPCLDARLPDGSRANAVLPPVSVDGPCLAIRKFSQTPMTTEMLILAGTLNAEMEEFLKIAVRSRRNIVICGATGVGKTSLLNALSHHIPAQERVVTIEEAAELQLPVENWVRLETRPPNLEGKGEITQRDLVRNALRMRPDRIIVGEARGGEALDMLQAMNTGHLGSMTTVHANSCRDALSRIEIMAMLAGLELPVHVIRRMMAASLHLLIHLERLPEGRRVVSEVAEVEGLEGETIRLQAIFRYDRAGGQHEWTGITPLLWDRLQEEGGTIPSLPNRQEGKAC